MYKIKPLLLAIFLLMLCFNAFSNAIAEDVTKEKELTKSILKAHIEFLADDSLKGRETGSKEYELAAQYVASHFQSNGLKPAAENGDWFQSVPLVESTLVKGSARMLFHSDNQTQSMNYSEDFITFPSATVAENAIKAPLVFAGYGIVSKAFGHNDYKHIEVAGKIAVLLVGSPIHFPNEVGAHVSDVREKIKQAALNGAIGVIIIDRPNNQTYKKLKEKAALPVLNWQRKNGTVFDEFTNLQNVSIVTSKTGEKIFEAANSKLADIYSAIENKQLPKGVDLNLAVTLKRKSTHKTITSSNVVGVLEGSDPKLKAEYVVLSAHLDHIGSLQSKTPKADLINNGALDNASGVAVMLETARRLSNGVRPKRSILFIAITAEEHGMLGSNYFAHNPTVPLSSMVANVNLDMVVMLYPFADVIAFGAEHSTLKQAINFAATKNGALLSPDPMPQKAVFVRSDHYSFVKQGIPAIYLMVGLTAKDSKLNGAQIFMQFYGKHYHMPTDDTSLPINYEAGAAFTNISIDTIKAIANKIEAPKWHENSFFGKILTIQ